jgi:hypothetical protein
LDARHADAPDPLSAPSLPEVLVLQHQQLVGPGSLAELVAERGWRWRLCRVDLGDPLPNPQAPGQILVVLGGTMGWPIATIPPMAGCRRSWS